jgi:hypothetical protein
VQETAAAIAAWRGRGNSIGVPIFLLVQARAQLAAGNAQAAHGTLGDAVLVSRLGREIWLQAHAARLRFEVERALGNHDAAVKALVESDRVAHAHGASLFASQRNES